MTAKAIARLLRKGIPQVVLMKCTEYRVGYEPFVMGKVFDPKKYPADASHYLIHVKNKGNPDHNGPDRWSIESIWGCLSKAGQWVRPGLPSSRGESFYERCRYPSAEVAVEYFYKWHAAAMVWADKKLKKNPEAIVEAHMLPRSVSFKNLCG